MEDIKDWLWTVGSVMSDGSDDQQKSSLYRILPSNMILRYEISDSVKLASNEMKNPAARFQYQVSF
jgi:hypothetical protein